MIKSSEMKKKDHEGVGKGSVKNILKPFIYGKRNTFPLSR